MANFSLLPAFLFHSLKLTIQFFRFGNVVEMIFFRIVPFSEQLILDLIGQWFSGQFRRY